MRAHTVKRGGDPDNEEDLILAMTALSALGVQKTRAIVAEYKSRGEVVPWLQRGGKTADQNCRDAATQALVEFTEFANSWLQVGVAPLPTQCC